MTQRNKFPLEAEMNYSFDRIRLEVCASCGKLQREHAGKDCLFEASEYKIHALRQFLDQIIRHGGELTLTSGPFKLTQKVNASMWDQVVDSAKVNIYTHGDVTFESADAEER